LKRISIAVSLLAGLILALLLIPTGAQSAAANNPIAFGFKATCTTDANGWCTIPHTLGVVPDAVEVQANSFMAMATTQRWTTTSIDVRLAKSISSSNAVSPWANVSKEVTVLGVYTPAVTTPTTSPTVTPTTTSPSPSPSPSTSASSSEFPNANNTGVPTGTVLTAYSGPTTITTNGTVIDSKTITGDLQIKATDVVIKNSKITNGSVYTPDGATNYSFTLQDSEVSNPGGVGSAGRTMVGEANFTVLRSEISGGNRGIYCRKNCTVQDSYVHGIQVVDNLHASAIRVSQGAKLIHNTVLCDAPDINSDGGCSADLTGYPDFEPVKNNTMQGNLFKATTGGFCAYGGTSTGKPYSNASDNATYIVFKDNVFERGTNRSDHGTFICGYYGSITDFNGSRTGNVWTNNKYDDGTVITQ
jgi:hypothetical protein